MEIYIDEKWTLIYSGTGRDERIDAKGSYTWGGSTSLISITYSGETISVNGRENENGNFIASAVDGDTNKFRVGHIGTNVSSASIVNGRIIKEHTSGEGDLWIGHSNEDAIATLLIDDDSKLTTTDVVIDGHAASLTIANGQLDASSVIVAKSHNGQLNLYHGNLAVGTLIIGQEPDSTGTVLITSSDAVGTADDLTVGKEGNGRRPPHRSVHEELPGLRS